MGLWRGGSGSKCLKSKRRMGGDEEGRGLRVEFRDLGRFV